MSVKEFLREIRPVISRAKSIQGFVITTRTEKSTVQLKWGDNRIRKWNKPKKSINSHAVIAIT